MEELNFTLVSRDSLYDNSLANLQASYNELAELLQQIEPTLEIVSRLMSEHHYETYDLFVLSTNSIEKRRLIEDMLWKKALSARIEVIETEYSFEELEERDGRLWPVEKLTRTLALKRLAYRRVSRFPRMIFILSLVICAAFVAYYVTSEIQ